MEHEQFTRLFAECERIIGSLRHRVPFPDSDRDDLVQEMALALLEMEGGTDNYCLTRAAWAAQRWLRRMYRTEMTSRLLTVARLTRLADGVRCRRVWC